MHPRYRNDAALLTCTLGCISAGRTERTEAVSEYLVIYEHNQTGWGAYCPDLPCLGVAGVTREEVEGLIHDAIERHIESLRERGHRAVDEFKAINDTQATTPVTRYWSAPGRRSAARFAGGTVARIGGARGCLLTRASARRA
jgi:predicted RNase H-like HicB family nuclease